MRSKFREMTVWSTLVALFVMIGFLLMACLTPPLESPDLITGRVRPVYVPQNIRNKVDILFMVDNSASMEPMQAELKARFSQFFQPFYLLAEKGTFADLNVGVVTSDFGANNAPGCTNSGPQGGGDQGKLQAVGKFADVSCQRPVGSNFIHYVFGNNGIPVNNLPGQQTLIDTFTCMASVGASGCGFEHQLESVYAALKTPIVENQGFLRDDAILVVVFVTNEDDASAPYDTDVFDRTLESTYGYEDSYSRQTQFAVQCGSPAAFPPYNDSNGPLNDCHAAPNPSNAGPGKQYDINRYINFFKQPKLSGGVKENPLDVVLIAIDAPPTPFNVILSNPGTPSGQPYVQCPALNTVISPACVPVLQHSCVNSNKTQFFGDPSIRLNEVINSVAQKQITSICEDSYAPALDAAAKLIVTSLSVGCLPDVLPKDNAGNVLIDCFVQDQTIRSDGVSLLAEVTQCDRYHSHMPCWNISVTSACADLSPDGVGLIIDRGLTNGQPTLASPHTTAIVSCASCASTSVNCHN